MSIVRAFPLFTKLRMTWSRGLPAPCTLASQPASFKKNCSSSVAKNLIIGLLAIIGAAVVGISSANLLLRPLEAISTSIDRLGLPDEQSRISADDLPRDQMVTGVTARLKQLGERMAGERSELELMRGRLRQVISHVEERLLLINREGRVILASPDAEQILGLTDVELTGLPIDETLGADHPLVTTVERAFNQRQSIARTTLHLPGTPASPASCFGPVHRGRERAGRRARQYSRL